MLDKAEFTFTRSQKKGILLLVLIILVAAGSLICFSYLIANRPLASSELDQNFAQPVTVLDSTFRLDINLADTSQWASLTGIGPKLGRRIVRYRNSIGGFSKVEQISKVYGISPEVYNSIKDHLYFNRFTAPQAPSKPKLSKKVKSYPRIDINTATADDFVKLPGIGKTLARRIIKYRNSIGGFSHTEELKRVYYLEPVIFNQIKPYLYLEVPASIFAEERKKEAQRLPELFASTQEKYSQTNPSPPISRGLDRGGAPTRRKAKPEVATPKPTISTLDLNLADSSLLSRLPGLDPKLAVRIIKYRKLLGFFYEVDQLKQVYGLSPQKFTEIKPYLKVVDISQFPKKDLNIVFARNLAFYPFIDKTIAEAIVTRRKELGHFQSWEEVLAVPGLTSEIFRKIRIYFEI